MYLAKIRIENFRCFGEGSQGFEMALKPGLTALVGENEAGKTAVIDALRLALGTTDQEWYPLEDADFHERGVSREIEIRITCRFERLTRADKRAFIEYLTYGKGKGAEPALIINWTAKDTGELRRGRPYRRIEIRSGEEADGPTLAPEVRPQLQTTYLRPLRDAEQALSAGRGSRLSQILLHSQGISKRGEPFDPELLKQGGINFESLKSLSVLGIGDLAGALLERHDAIADTRANLNARLGELSLGDNANKSNVKISGAKAPEHVRLRQLLEKLDLLLEGRGKLGLGSNNLLFIACELLLLSQEEANNRLLLIEEPEAHLHAQRQLRVMRYLQEEASEHGIQIIVTTHSPNLASVIALDNMVMIRSGRAFSMAEGRTRLEHSDYRFLERFLDVTKANMFFARGVMIVEGDAESILLPTLAHLIGRDFTKHGVSIVNVGGLGLRRYARVFQRKDPQKDGSLDIPVACVTDMDVMPDCAPAIIGKLRGSDDWPATGGRQWRAKRDFQGCEILLAHRRAKEGKASGEFVKTFVSDEWTLEYDLALGPRDEKGEWHGGLAEDVFVAACLAEQDDRINANTTTVPAEVKVALERFAEIKKDAAACGASTPAEVLASHVYAKFAREEVSKAVAAQYLAERLEAHRENNTLAPNDLRSRLPKYLVKAIDYVTGREIGDAKRSGGPAAHD